MLSKIKILSLLSLFMLLGALQAHAQWGVSYHQSSMPFVGINYTFSERFMPELRVATDRGRYTDHFIIEGTFNYQFVQRDDYQFYAGLGFVGVESAIPVVIPAGILIYPFENKKFGFHMEVAPIIWSYSSYLRGSWGIRYRFLKD